MSDARRETCLEAALFGAAVLTLCACEGREPIGATQAAVTGGEIADGPEFDAVMCIPHYAHTEGCESHGWADCLLRCAATATLITPNVAIAQRGRLVRQSYPITLGYQTRTGVRAPEELYHTKIEVGSAVNAVDDGPTVLRNAVRCLEMRRSGLAPCCWHVFITDASLGEGTFGDELPKRYYAPPPEQWDDPFPACSPSADGCITTEPGRTPYANYRQYRDICEVPMAPDDGVISDSILLLLSERVDEAEIAAIPLALTYPDGTSNPAWFDTLGSEGGPILGDNVGYGYGEPGIRLDGLREGIRRVVYASVGLSLVPPPSGVVTVNHTSLGERLPNSVLWRNTATSVPGAGAHHVDFGAPWIYAAGGTRRVYSVSSGTAVTALAVVFDAPLTAVSASGLRAFLDPDDDGFHRGSLDAVSSSSDSPRAGYLDADRDGLSEYREVARRPDTPCVPEVTVPASPGTCWVATGNDNCGPPPDAHGTLSYRNRDQRDRDGDGAGDVCDVCPNMWDDQQYCVAPRDAPFVVDGRVIRRGDRVGIACARLLDSRTGARVPATQLDMCGGSACNADADGDGFLDAFCDNCPGLANAGQEDGDGDGYGDDCDICPDHTNPAQDPTDLDGDDVPDECDNCPPSLCAIPTDCANADQSDRDDDGLGDACDNCPDRFNPAQANCNAEAEAARGVGPRGDACDPVPCAETRITEWREATTPLGETTIHMGDVVFDARIGIDAPDPAPTPSLDARTTFRFCRCGDATADTPSVRDSCADPVRDEGTDTIVDAGCTLLDLAAHDATVESVPWRWTTQELIDSPLTPRTTPTICLSDRDCTAGNRCIANLCRCVGTCVHRPPVVLNPQIAATYAAPDGTFTADGRTRWWLFEADIPRWIADGIRPGETFSTVSVPGVFWTHSPGPVGRPDFDELPEYGFEFRELASYYWSGGVLASITVREPFPCIVPIVPFLASNEICPLCPFHVPEPWIAFPAFPRCPDVRLDLPFIQLGPNPLEPLPGLELAGLDLFANDPGPWTAAAETGPSLWREAGLRYVKLVDGAQVTRVLIEQQGRFIDLKDGCSQQTCNVFPSLATPVSAEASAAAGEAPSPREGHLAVLSAHRNALWVLGGREIGSGRELRDLWRYDVITQRWSSLAVPPQLGGRVLAATYSPVEDRLWVLVEIEGDSVARQVRLVAVHPAGGMAEVVATWPRRARNEVFAMSVDPSGAIWIAGWPTAGRVHAVLRLVRTPEGFVSAGWDLGVGRIRSSGVRASDRGLTVVAEIDGRPPELVFHDVHALRTGPGGERACF